MKYADLVTNVPQSEPLDDRQVENNAGGYAYGIDDWSRLDRFLILGSDAPTYYQGARELTRENARVVGRCLDEDPERTVARIVEISHSGRAPKNDPAIFALAMGAAHGNVATRQAALSALPKVCRTATHLFQFVSAARALGRGWGRSLKNAVASWYDGRSADAVALQAIKYRAREGYTHKRLLQTAHPEGDKDTAREALYRWICEKEHDATALPAIVQAHETAMTLGAGKELTALVEKHKLPWEAIPTDATKDPGVWKAMLPDMGLTAMIRNLGAMTAYGALKPMGEEIETVVSRLTSEEALKNARVHPFAILQALAVYRSGRGVRGALSWEPIGPVMRALDQAFYLAFQNVEATGKRTLLALDVSGSMGANAIGSVLTAREGAAAMALVTARTEANWHAVGFSHELVPLQFDASAGLGDVVEATSRIPFGRTDCAQPMLYALRKGLSVDSFVIYTDNETWAGRVHPVQALREYRRTTGINAKLIVVGMTSTGFSIADPNDGGMLDVVGFDASAPAVMADFMRQ